MKTIINTENYEAYLLDYQEGNLSHEETTQLKAYIEAQGLDWAELTEPLPRLEAPQNGFVNKERLKKNAVAVPLYVKIASAAAAAGLLLTVGLWPGKSMPKVEPVAELKPIEAQVTSDGLAPRLVPRRTVQLAAMPSSPSNEDADNTPEQVATLSPLKAQSIASAYNPEAAFASDLAQLRYQMETGQAFEQLVFEPSLEEEMPASFIGRAIYRWSQGRYSSVNDLVNAGLAHSKQEIADVTTEIAMEMQQRTEEYFADAKDYWKTKLEE